MMLDHLGHAALHGRIVSAIERVVASGKLTTPDLGGKATTSQVASAISSEV
jgi:isocitrate/isopropylmalate dehydrogenase